MAWALRQSKAAGFGAATTADAVTFDSTTLSGSLIVVVYSVQDKDLGFGANVITATCADDAPQSYTQIRRTFSASFVAGWTLFSFYMKNAAAANTVTVTKSSACDFGRVIVMEFTGGDTTAPLDQDNGATGNSAAPSGGSVTTTADGELIVGGVMGANSDVAAGTGYTGVAGNDGYLYAEYKVQTTAGSVSAAFTQTSGEWLAHVMSFKVAGGAAATRGAPFGARGAAFNGGRTMMGLIR